MVNLSVVIPTYNERENIEKLIPAIFAALEGDNRCEVIVVDDSSPDGTADVVRWLAEKFDVRLFVRPMKMGLTTAVIEGISKARGEIICVMDADFSHPPKKLEELVAKLQYCDIAIASRYVEGGGIKNWPLKRKIISWMAIKLVRIILNVKVRDPVSGFFAIRKDILDKTDFRVKGYKILSNILARNKGLKIEEVPYIFVDRTRGESKLRPGEISQFVRDILVLRFG